MALKATWKQTAILFACLSLLLSLAPALAFADVTKIDSVEVVGITKPVAGELPLENGTVTGHAKVDEWLWYEMGDDGYFKEYFEQTGGISHKKAFQDGPCYALQLRIKPETGYSLEDTKIKYEGSVLEEPDISTRFITVSHVFQRIEGDVVWVRIVFQKADAPDNTDNGLSVVNAGSLNIRNAKDGDRIGGLSYGDVVKVLAVDSEWSKIAYNDVEGWVKSEFLLRTYSKATAVKPMKYTVTNANAINVRKNILVTSERLGGLEKGDEFYVTGMRGNSAGELWYVLDYNGQLAYVRGDLVAPAGEKAPSVPFVFDQIIDSIMLNFSGSSASSTATKRMIYKAGAPVSSNSIKDKGNGSCEIVLFPDDGYNLSGIASPKDIKLSSSGYVVTSVTANSNGSLTITMAKLDCAALDKGSASRFATLRAKAGKATNSSIALTWSKVKGASKYKVYGAKNSAGKLKLLKSTSRSTATLKGLKKGTHYKYLVVATNGKGRVLSIGKPVYACTTGGKYANCKSVTTAAKKGKVTLKKGRTFKLQAKAVTASSSKALKKLRALKYETTKKSIATVSNKGTIRAKAKGTCYVYAYAQNGACAKVKVTVK